MKSRKYKLLKFENNNDQLRFELIIRLIDKLESKISFQAEDHLWDQIANSIQLKINLELGNELYFAITQELE